jgi:diguanylate cyclase (GGDEF)-like protein
MLLISVAALAPFDDQTPSCGDTLLETVAEVVFGASENERGFIARYDDDVCAVALPVTDHEGAKRLAEELRSVIEMSGFADAHNRAGRRLAAAIGMATIVPTERDRVEKIVCFADIALHRAKTADRNGVYAFHDDPSCSKAKRSPTGGVGIPVIETSHCAECRRDAPRA